MLKVFVEYKVKSSEYKQFLSLLPQIKALHEKQWSVLHYKVFAGTDQPNLVVEEFHVQSIQEFRDIKKFRQADQDQLWKSFEECLLGDRDKVNIWSFKNINLA